jgi:hypothetical protein
MQQTYLKGRNETANELSVRLSDKEYTLNLAMVYQDTPTRQWAGKVQDQLAELVGGETIHCTEWKIDDLNNPGIYSKGVAALARADVIVVSIYEARRLPSAFYLWVNLWLQVRSWRPGALVALVVPAEGSDRGAGETRRYLCAVASQGGLDLLESNRPSEPIPDLREDIHQWATAA